MLQEPELIVMGFTEWISIYKPIKNPYISYADYYEFDTLGEQFQMVLRAHKSNNFCIWTWLDADAFDDCPSGYILNGSHFCNRSGLSITELSWPDNTIIEVVIDD